jgi:predicted protein tyrosine phosphatase
MTLIVCGLHSVEDLIAARRPSHMITLLDPWSMIRTPAGIDPARHLRLEVNDIREPVEGMVAPSEELIVRILAFGRLWDEQAPMLVHCWAGVSRSTATAFILACERSPQTPEADIALAMRQAAPHAYPNRWMVRLADDMLGRRGRMVDAIAGMGEESYVTAGTPFDFAPRR